METNLLDRMLDTYLAEQTSVIVTLQNNIHVSGRIKAFDSYVIVVEGQKREIVYRHAVSSITTNTASEQKRRPLLSKPGTNKATPLKPDVKNQQKNGGTQRHSSPAAEAQSLHNTMKDGLLKWIQGQKAAK
jgi:RNA chaperone Hfq